jgi:hypothetical protein
VIRDHRASGEVAIITTGDVLDVDAAGLAWSPLVASLTPMRQGLIYMHDRRRGSLYGRQSWHAGQIRTRRRRMKRLIGVTALATLGLSYSAHAAVEQDPVEEPVAVVEPEVVVWTGDSKDHVGYGPVVGVVEVVR